MRHINLDYFLTELDAHPDGPSIRKSLSRALATAGSRDAGDIRRNYIKKNGPAKWKRVKDIWVELHPTCWYTEALPTGADLEVDHFRPKSRYWWLAFDPENYRISCTFANSQRRIDGSDTLVGKGSEFPLAAKARRASSKGKLRYENPLLLDPCSQDDVELLAFQSDGHPVVNPKFRADDTATERVDRSTVAFNLAHPHFNEGRERLFLDIKTDVESHEALPAGSPQQAAVRARLERRISIGEPFSAAARQYLRFYRYLDWVEAML